MLQETTEDGRNGRITKQIPKLKFTQSRQEKLFPTVLPRYTCRNLTNSVR